MFEILEFIEEPPNALWKKKRAEFHTFYTPFDNVRNFGIY